LVIRDQLGRQVVLQVIPGQPAILVIRAPRVTKETPAPRATQVQRVVKAIPALREIKVIPDPPEVKVTPGMWVIQAPRVIRAIRVILGPLVIKETPGTKDKLGIRGTLVLREKLVPQEWGILDPLAIWATRDKRVIKGKLAIWVIQAPLVTL